MTILRDTYGNKIQRNASGEVLYKSDALIDLRSTFGVTKDGSNNVSKVKLFNSPPQVFRDNGSNCIENGDGFNFSLNTNGHLEGQPFKDISGDFFIGWWGKYLEASLTANKMTFGAYASGSPSIYCYISNSTNKITLYYNGTDVMSEFSVNVIVDQTQWNYYSIERRGSSAYFSRNGKLSYIDTTAAGTLTCNGNKIEIANTGGVNNQPNDGNLDDLRIIPKAIYNYTGKSVLDQVFTPPKRSSE